MVSSCLVSSSFAAVKRKLKNEGDSSGMAQWARSPRAATCSRRRRLSVCARCAACRSAPGNRSSVASRCRCHRRWRCAPSLVSRTIWRSDSRCRSARIAWSGSVTRLALCPHPNWLFQKFKRNFIDMRILGR